VGTAYSRAGEGFITVNMLEPGEIAGCVARVRPWCVIHCAATRKPDVCEHDPEQTQRLNVEAARNVAVAAAKAGAWMVHISTDYVFDGTRPPYGPEAAPNPLNAYGRSKLASEQVVREVSADCCILRVPILYGPVESLDESPVTVIAADLLAGKGGRVDNWATRYPTHTADVAFVIRQLIEHKSKDPAFSGICHWSGNEPFTKFGMAQIFCHILDIPKDTITPQDSPPPGTPRPKNSHLDCSRLESLHIGRQTPFKKGAADAIRPFLPTR
jgi:dTDP-4-dehydrorhamnose reductase